MGENKMTIDEIIKHAEKGLPPGWRIEIVVMNGESKLGLLDPNGEKKEHCDDNGIGWQIIDAVNLSNVLRVKP